MGFGLPFDLEYLANRFIAHSHRGVVRAQGLAFGIDVLVHAAVTQVAVVGNGKGDLAGSILGLEKLPEIFRSLGFQRAEGHVGDITAAVDNIAVQVNFLDVTKGRPFVADKRGKYAGFIVAFSGCDSRLPRGPDDIQVDVAFTEARVPDQLHGFYPGQADRELTALEQQIPQWAFSQGHVRYRGPGHAHILGVIGNRKKIQRPRNANRITRTVADGAAPGEGVGVFGQRSHAHGEGVGR